MLAFGSLFVCLMLATCYCAANGLIVRLTAVSVSQKTSEAVNPDW